MRVAIAQGAFLPVPPVRGGAVEKIWFDLAMELVGLGHEVKHYSRAVDELPVSGCMEGVEHVRVKGYNRPRSLSQALMLDFVYSQRVRNMFVPSDIVITHSFWLPLVLPRRRSGPICVHVARMPRRQLDLYRRVERLQAVSTAVRDLIAVQSPRMLARTKVFPNPLPRVWVGKTTDLHKEREQEILFLGRMHPEKGISLLIDAWGRASHHLSKWKLKCVGPFDVAAGGGGAAFRDRLTRQITALGLDTTVTLVEPTYDLEALRQHYTSASLLVYPSLAGSGESFGMVPLEAMACGCVPVVSNLPCFREYVRDGVNAFVFDHLCEDPVQALAFALVKAGNSVCEHIRLEGGRTAADFTPKSAAMRLDADFQELIEEDHRR